MSHVAKLVPNQKLYQQARLSRDRRFDGLFFVAVKTTGIFCRPICPANLPKEHNVEYFEHAAMALKAGYRPCKRCHPDSAPTSWRWLGTETTLQRAVQLIDQGYLQHNSLAALADKLGISDRYLRTLFTRYMGLSPKQYAQYQQLMFAKNLLHNSSLSITDIGLASGFNSIRRFNDAFQKVLQMTPTDLRRQQSSVKSTNQVMLAIRTPYDWRTLLAFYQTRSIQGVETVSTSSYRRSLIYQNKLCWFEVDFSPLEKGLHVVELRFDLAELTQLRTLLVKVRRMLDLDTDTEVIERHLSVLEPHLILKPGLRIPGVWDTWEAGVRAILGQQVSIKAAIGQLNLLVQTLCHSDNLYFPTPTQVAQADLSFLRMPQARKDTLRRLAEFMIENPNNHPEQWLELKGIGPWTVNYAMLRGLSDPNCFLSSDLVVKKALGHFPNLDPKTTSPWGSYATFHCWSHYS
ncbi:DNA-3-methyladenine glycosylase 2 family protein [Vibrio sp. WXL210]|uniref:DNA-3-methyladenine glycosylase 2 family protein n=1 Tax=Vibrio sp. WXL210 TaxID=3450709 RepID=UPI003EC58F78